MPRVLPESGLGPLEASFKAMREVTGPIIAVALVLCAVFVPAAFVSGITGQFYRQFALTIAVSTVLSAFNSLTLSPALAALLLRPKEAKPDLFTRMLNFRSGRSDSLPTLRGGLRGVLISQMRLNSELSQQLDAIVRRRLALLITDSRFPLSYTPNPPTP